MKKYNYIITALTLLTLPIFAYADCTADEITHFKEIESKYRIVTTLNKENNNYSIILYNPEPTKYTYKVNNGYLNAFCNISDDSDSECNKVPPGSYVMLITGNTENCNETLKRLYLRLNSYNKYSEDPLCKGNEEFVLCQETYNKEIDYDTFVSRLNIYKNTKEKEQEESKNEIIDIDKIVEYVEDNMLQIIVIATFIIVLIVTIVLTIKSIKKSRRLE